MASIDERVVAMSFENAKFEAGVATTLGTIAKLDASIKNLSNASGFENIEKAASKVTLQQPMSAFGKFKSVLGTIGNGATDGFSAIERAGSKLSFLNPFRAVDKLNAKFSEVGNGAEQGFADVERAGNRVDFRPLSAGVDSVSAKFSEMTVIATSALSTLTMDFTRKARTWANSFTFAPITQGLDEYKTNLSSIQTVLANTQVSGATLGDVNAHLQELNHYSDQTIYNFSEMAKNIGTFTAAGVDLDKSTQSIKGIANLAALSGSNSQQAATAMYQLSQAISSGKVGLQDWNSVVNAGMGGTVFQRALAQTAEKMGTLGGRSVELVGAMKNVKIGGESFRESMMGGMGKPPPWLTSDVLVKTLQQFTADMTDAELATQGFTKEQIKAIQKQAQTAKHAATEVKTLSQVFDVAKETIGSGWSATFQNIFGDFGESKKTFTEMSNALNGFINKNADARNKVLAGWKKLGGRDELIEGFKNAAEAIGSVLKPISEAFREIFPKQSAKDLVEITKGFSNLMENLKIGPETARNLKETFKGLFAVLHIGWTITKGVLGVIGDLLGLFGKGTGGILKYTGSIGNFLVALDNTISRGKALQGVFDLISAALQQPLQFLKSMIDLFKELFFGDEADMSARFEGMAEKIGPLGKVVEWLVEKWQDLRRTFEEIKRVLAPFAEAIGNELDKAAEKIKGFFETLTSDKALKIAQTGLLGGILWQLKKIVGGLDLSVGLKGVGQLSEALKTLTGSVASLQGTLDAAKIFLIAAAIGLLAVSVGLLAKIDTAGLSRAMTTVSVGLGELIAAVALLGYLSKGMQSVGIATVAVSLIALAFAVDLLAVALKIMSTMSWDELAVGLTSMAGALAIVAGATKFIGPQIAIIGPALIPLAFGITLLASAVRLFSDIPFEKMLVGLYGMAGSLAAVGLGVRAIPPGITLIAPGLIGVGLALVFITQAISSLGGMDLDDLAKGIGGVGIALALIGTGLMFIPVTAVAQAAALLVLGFALSGIAVAVRLFGTMNWGTLAKGLIALGLSLDILALGLTAMIGAAPGALALMGAAAALAVLVPTIGLLGVMPWLVIVKGLVGMVVILGVLAGVGALIAGPLAALGGALQVLGFAMLTIAGAFLVFGTALRILSVVGTKGLIVLGAAILGFIKFLPELLKEFLMGFVEVIGAIATLLPKIAVALGRVIDEIIAFLITQVPKLTVLMGVIIDTLVVVLAENAPKLIAAGALLIYNILDGLDKNVQKMVHQASVIIVKFLDQMRREAPRITKSGADALVAWLKGISDNLVRVLTAGYKIGINFLNGIAQNAPKFVAAGAKAITVFLQSIADRLPGVIAAGGRLIVKFIDGVSSQYDDIAAAAHRAIRRFVTAIGDKEEVRKTVRAGFQAAINFIDGITEGIEDGDQIDKLIQSAAKLGFAIITGVSKGLAKLPLTLGKKLFEPFGDALDKVKKKLDSHSPSKVFIGIGQDIVTGTEIGLVGMSTALERGITNPIGKMLQQNKDVKAFGKFLGKDFMDAVSGGFDPIKMGATQEKVLAGFDSLKSKLGEEQKKLRDQIKADRDKIKQLEDDPDKPNVIPLEKANAALREHEKLLAASKTASKNLIAGLGDEKNQLLHLAGQYDDLTEQLKDANAALEKAKSDQKAFAESTSDQYAALPGFQDSIQAIMDDMDLTWEERQEKRRAKEKEEAKLRKIDQVAEYKKALEEQIKATEKYNLTLAKLRELKLDDATYGKLVKDGLKDQDFADQLLRSGKAGIEAINDLDKKLLAEAGDLALNAADEMYNAGIKAAEGIVMGLERDRGKIVAQMDWIGQQMVASIKKQLGIRSPSRVLAEVGKFTAQGLVAGLKASSQTVANAAAGIGDDAATAMAQSLAHISDVLSSEIDPDMTITPVLDLSQVQKDAKKLGDLTNVTPITAAASFGQASAISGDVAATQEALAAAAAGAPTVIFEQTNNSPESLSNVEIYRNTKNLLSQAKSALGVAS